MTDKLPNNLALASTKDAIHLRLLETVYPLPSRQVRHRPESQPMQVLCLGLPRTGTESLATALEILGVGPVYHGWNNNSDPRDCATFCAFASHKRTTGDLIPRQAFEQIWADRAVAVADFPATAFSKDLVEAYPDAKIILNKRMAGKEYTDEEAKAWKKSMWDSFVGIAEGRFIGYAAKLFGLASRFESEAAWVNINYTWVYRPYWKHNFQGNAEATYKRHYLELEEATRGRREVLHWSVEDGWEPLCNFLQKPIPSEPFPHSNKGNDFDKRVMQLYQHRFKRAFRNVFILLVTLVAVVTALVLARR